MPITTCIFDAYGTLFDVASAARRLAQAHDGTEFARLWPQIARDWRLKQLQYTWLRAITGEHCDFDQITADSLDWTLEATGLQDDPDLRAELLELYQSLDAYPEVPEMLSTLKTDGLNTVILTNGRPDTMAKIARTAGLSDDLDDILSVEAVGVYKPAATVYAMVEQRFGTTPDQVLFVSSNCWDAIAATGFGFRTAWANRAGEPMDRLAHQPTRILEDLSSIPQLAGSL